MGCCPCSKASPRAWDRCPPPRWRRPSAWACHPRQILLGVELPLAAPLILAGVRTSVTINIGTAAIAATVGAQNLGSPIIIGLSGFNTAYVLQGALLTGLLAVTVDRFFEWGQHTLARRAGALPAGTSAA